ncbi:MAG: helix-turn-helix transcriptional regulator [Williamsia sp.]|nr:helix-turn-helix transcriptional regulator [Williamsia sp.]
MQIVKLCVFTGAKMEEAALINKVPASLSSYAVAGAKNKAATGSFGAVVVTEMRAGSYVLTFARFIFVAPATVELKIAEPVIELDLALEGSIHLKSFQQVLPQGRFNVFYDPGCNRTIEFSARRNYSLLTIHLRDSHLAAFIPHYRTVSGFVQSVRRSKEARLGKVSCSMDVGMQKFVRDMICVQNPLSLDSGRLEAMVRYLILCFIESLNVSTQTARSTNMLYDSDRILKAAESMVMEPQNFERLPEIARKWQINPQRLKDEFRRLIRMPVYAFKIKLRMEQARQQLLETDKSVREISLSLGYNNTAYFSRMFKKHMGDSPLSFRKKAVQRLNVALRSKAGVMS